MLLQYLCIISTLVHLVSPQSTRELDSLLQDYAFRSLVRPKTGVVYPAALPSNLTGIHVAALRLRSGSMRRRGFQGFREFDIPIGVVEQPYVQRVVLVYHNLSSQVSPRFYPLPGYTLLTPVLGLLVYNASDLSARNLSELDFRASARPVRVNFGSVGLGLGSRPMCVYFGLDGSVQFDNVVNSDGNFSLTCLATNQGHYSIVVPEMGMAPALSPSGGGGGGGIGGGSGGNGRRRRTVGIVVGSVIGGVVVLTLLVVMVGCLRKCVHKKKIRRMEDAADSGVVLPMTRVGNTKAPVAMETRTRPLLENEFVP